MKLHKILAELHELMEECQKRERTGDVFRASKYKKDKHLQHIPTNLLIQVLVQYWLSISSKLAQY